MLIPVLTPVEFFLTFLLLNVQTFPSSKAPIMQPYISILLYSVENRQL